MNKSIIYKAKEDKDIQEDLRKLRALQQEPCEDCISRQALLKLMGEEPFNWTDSDKELQEVEDYRNFRNIVEQLPSVNPQKIGWIPVSERLPEKGGDYLVTNVFDIGDKEPVREVNKDYYCYHSKKWLYENENIIAWMPLPESYKESEE